MAKTYNSGDSLMVTHSTTSPPVRCLNRAERTGSLVFNVLWSYVMSRAEYMISILYQIFITPVQITILDRKVHWKLSSDEIFGSLFRSVIMARLRFSAIGRRQRNTIKPNMMKKKTVRCERGSYRT
ncbi:hypothetical protein DE146DRAFT_142482 [Phaeosphaeria sp. MPI-PUGE-AT-0046c]|nr:hypothetical protein DE146DRAFT_142482 [Phaeosphaeria sp. MPI-PUGE-AT-0046c]